ncbi:hypothetical protein BCR44DRAFT_85811 [Catenaria anguillulae PL171]|uniref:Uncharacterized protein n=1 Tax=Catenaria anguillulae PL171 TaxID=765915 RepID=A0A1Y2HGR1_9FUNG|nr:hypothetical protein BCR44DRAFT_85811 [Catenaria anguillulae PL171]
MTDRLWKKKESHAYALASSCAAPSPRYCRQHGSKACSFQLVGECERPNENTEPLPPKRPCHCTRESRRQCRQLTPIALF